MGKYREHGSHHLAPSLLAEEASRGATSAERPIPLHWYLREDVVNLAQELLGKVIRTEFDGVVTSAIITETEADRGPEDRASHAWNNRRTARTETMFAEGGVAYVYLCYGIHHLFNVVTGPKDLPHAVLLRAVEPVEGLEAMLQRRGLEADRFDDSGPLCEGSGLGGPCTGIAHCAFRTAAARPPGKHPHPRRRPCRTAGGHPGGAPRGCGLCRRGRQAALALHLEAADALKNFGHIDQPPK